jgi:uncharacterized protein
MRQWFINRAPDREALQKHPWLAPVASRLASPSVWQFNRRSVARGLALGLFAGFIIPLGQIVLAVLFAASVRANILVASAATLVTNPLTFPPIYYAAYRTGGFLLGKLDSGSPAPHITATAPPGLWAMAGTTSLSLVLGLLVFATLSSLVAFVAVHLAWRVSLVLRWRRRRAAR